MHSQGSGIPSQFQGVRGRIIYGSRITRKNKSMPSSTSLHAVNALTMLNTPNLMGEKDVGKSEKEGSKREECLLPVEMEEGTGGMQLERESKRRKLNDDDKREITETFRLGLGERVLGDMPSLSLDTDRSTTESSSTAGNSKGNSTSVELKTP